MKIIYKSIKNCLVCNNIMKQIISLPNYPVTEFYTHRKIQSKNFYINQKLLFCDKCKHISLKNIIDQNFFYKNYIMKSKSAIKYSSEYLINFKYFIKKNLKKNSKKDLIVDIGGNDSSFLKFFDKIKKVNIDPNASGTKKIVKIKSYFENVDFSYFKNKNKIYVSSHTVEHIPDLNSLIKKVSNSLQKKDLLFLQFPSLEKLIENSKFDQITHQHVNLYSLKSISKLLNKFDLYVKKYEFDNSVYGTLRMCICKSKYKNKHNTKLSYKTIRNKYLNFKKFYKSYERIIKDEKKLIGFGAGMMVPSLNYYLPSLNNLKFILDNDKNKNNKYFINMKPRIKFFDGKFEKFKNYKIIITSISTENTLKKITKKLIENKLDFFTPFFKI